MIIDTSSATRRLVKIQYLIRAKMFLYCTKLLVCTVDYTCIILIADDIPEVSDSRKQYVVLKQPLLRPTFASVSIATSYFTDKLCQAVSYNLLKLMA